LKRDHGRRNDSGMTRGLVILLLMMLSIGCGGSTKAADEPDTMEDEELSESADDTGGSEAASSDETGGGKEAGGSGSAGSASLEDRLKVLQLVIDDEALEPYLKLGEPGRFPLAISGDNIPEGLVKATKPVKIVGEPATPKEAVLVFTEIDVRADQATVRYRYAVEDIKGTANLKKVEGRWELTNSRVTQHRAAP
jgi:hypothetical protein